MSLTLLTGPANAAKAGFAFDRLRSQLARDPLLVVPTGADVEHYQRELAESGIVFGAQVVRFDRLIRLVAEATGVPGRPLGRVARERVLRAAISDARLELLAESAASAGFARAAGTLIAELQRSMVTPARLLSALRAWGEQGGGGSRRAQAEEVAGIYAGYRRRLESLGAHDAEGFAWAALDALRSRPALWKARPVVFYGFDDLTPTELDAVETLVRRAETDVLVALPYEPGRIAFAGRATTVELLRPLAGEHIALPDRSEHYAAGSRDALHHLERRLFEPGSPVAAPGGAVRLLEAGGERAEAELVAAQVLELVASGVAAEEIAVLVRDGSPSRELMGEVLAAYGVAVAQDRRVPLARTRLGAGLLALARAATGAGTPRGEGTPEDLIRWLRTPGRLAAAEPVDALEAAVRRRRVGGVGAARRLWTGPAEVLETLDGVAAAGREGPVALLAALSDEARTIWTAPHRRRAAVLDDEEAADARVAAELRSAIAELRRLAEADASLLPGPGEALEALAEVTVREREARAGVLIADPLQIRARRFRAVFATGLQDGEFPRRPTPDPFLDDDDRRALARASGLVLALGEDVLAADRYLFYATCSRPEELLALSWRSSSEEGDPLQASPFVEDVRLLFDSSLWEARRRRLLAEVTWAPDDAPTPLERRRALAAARRDPEPGALPPPASEAVLAALASRDHESARGLETFSACGVRWVVDFMLRPRAIDPDPDPLWRGSLAHAVLETTLSRLKETTGSARLTPDSLPAALGELDAALSEADARARSAAESAALRAVRANLVRYLRLECEQGPGLEPAALEWTFGRDDDGPGPLVLDDGTRVAGRIDRVDVGDGKAIVRDYKLSTAHAAARWNEKRSLQAGLYALAVRALMGLEPVAALYQPLSGGELRPRGIVRAGVEGSYVSRDVLDDDAFESALSEVRELAVQAAADIRSGRVAPCPSRCSTRGCMYPGICRAPAVETQPDASNGEDAP